MGVEDGLTHPVNRLFDTRQFFKAVGQPKLVLPDRDQITLGMDTKFARKVHDPGVFVRWKSIDFPPAGGPG